MVLRSTLNRRSIVALPGAAALGVLAAGCGSAGGGGAGSAPGTERQVPGAAPTVAPVRDVALTLYNAQHTDLMEAMVGGFMRDHGIMVNMRAGKDFEMANQLVQEGAASPADVFVTENSPAMQVVAAKGLFAKVAPGTLAQVPARYSPKSGDWIGMAARVTALIYNPALLSAAGIGVPEGVLSFAAAGAAVPWGRHAAHVALVDGARVALYAAAALRWREGTNTAREARDVPEIAGAPVAEGTLPNAWGAEAALSVTAPVSLRTDGRP